MHSLTKPVRRKATLIVPLLVCLTVLIGTALALLLTASSSKSVNALTVSDWRAGRIIDDYVFTNASALNTTQIQTFLNSKVAICDTNGTQQSEMNNNGVPDYNSNGSIQRWEWGQAKYGQTTFICLKDFSEGNKSSAQIIYDAAQEFQINPQVLLVLLQKEQGLVTDTWPLNIQYRSATGYGCPDTAPCDSEYYGLTNQIRWAARMFRAIMNASPTWYTPYLIGNNNIQFNPNSSCGQSTVFIENRSTQALYNYTPYQPNSATLNWKLGNGSAVSSAHPGCGAFGNINFLLYFTEWFGSVRAYRGTQPSSSTSYALATTCRIGDFASPSVGRLYNPDTGDYLFTTSRQEACQAVKLGYIWDGIALTSVSQDEESKIPVYRLQYLSLHYYTTSLEEKNSYILQGFRDEGIITYLYTSSVPNSIPVYGIEKSGIGPLFTSAGDEGTYLVNELGYKSLGIIGYTQLNNGDPQSLYRLRKANDRLYTSSLNERNSAVALGYANEGSTLRVDTQPDIYNRPVYRLLSPTGLHFYTTSREERDLAIINYGHHSEGTGFYTPPSNLPGVQPVYKMTNYSMGNTRLYTQYSAEVGGARTYFGFTSEGIGWYGY